MRVATLLLCVGLLCGCSRTSPYHTAIKADSPISLSLWRSKVGESLSTREWSLFDKATQEIKLKIMADGDATGAAAIEQTLRERIDKKPLYDVVHSGLQFRLNRLLSEKSELETFINQNARL